MDMHVHTIFNNINVKCIIRSEKFMSNNRETFWDHACFAVITDNTKPAMKWTIEELKKSGKNVHVVDLSDNPGSGTIQDPASLPGEVDCAVIGITKNEPADLIDILSGKGIKNIWIHWNTDTPGAREKCRDLDCITGRCPMMYLGHGLSIHTLHREIAKLTKNY